MHARTHAQVLQGAALEATAGLTSTRDEQLYEFAKVTTAAMAKDATGLDTIAIPSLDARNEL